MESAMTAAIYRVLMNGMKNAAGGTSALSPEMIASAASWAIYGAVKQWFYTPARRPAEEIVHPILQLVFPILQAAASPQRQPAATQP
jgi:hypothetical protein